MHLLYQQINPHLLYNTLESIYWKSTMEGNTESAEMIKDLSKLMKISLSRGGISSRLGKSLSMRGLYQSATEPLRLSVYRSLGSARVLAGEPSAEDYAAPAAGERDHSWH